MGSSPAKIALACLLACGFLLWPGVTPAADARRAAAFAPAQGQEVVTGQYLCGGTVYTDGQPAQVAVYTFLTATSGITSGLYGPSRSSENVPADLDALAAICDAHVERVVSHFPAICALGPIDRSRNEFGNGSGTGARFDFSCQGTRDEVIGVIGGLSRLTLTDRLP
jgi:hypothetical protein